MPGARVIVTDAEERSALAACRALAAAGYRVGAAAARTPAPGHWSRAAALRLRVPPPTDPDAFVDALVPLLERHPHDLLLPGSDAALLAVSAARERLEPLVRLALPPHEAVELAVDKVALLRLAADAGLPAPESAVCADLAEARHAAGRLGYPLVLKPGRSFAGGRYRPVEVADDEDGLGAVSRLGSPVVLQRFERGARLHSFAGVVRGGRLLGYVFSRYLRTWPPAAGPVAAGVSEDAPDDLPGRVEALLAAAGWEGIFELELIRHPDGTLGATDLNPRIYGSMSLALAAGVNLPALWVEAVLAGSEPERPAVGRAGVRYRFDDADLRHVARALGRGRLGEAAAVARPRRPTAHAYADLADPAPLAARLLQLVGSARRRRRDGRPAEAAVAGAQYALAYGVAIPLLFLAHLEALARGLAGAGGR